MILDATRATSGFEPEAGEGWAQPVAELQERIGSCENGQVMV